MSFEAPLSATRVAAAARESWGSALLWIYTRLTPRTARPGVAVAALVVLAIYLASVSPGWNVSSDSALYLMLGENLAAGEGYTLWGVAHRHVPPGYPALLAGLMWIVPGSLLWLNTWGLLLALATLWLVYLCMYRFTSRPRAAIVAVCVGGTYLMHHNSVRLLSDVPFMLLFWLGLWDCLKWRNGERGLPAIGVAAWILAATVRVAGWPLILLAGLVLLWEGQGAAKRRWPALLALLCILLAIMAEVAYCVALGGDGTPSYGSALQKLWERTPEKTWERTLIASEGLYDSLSAALLGQKLRYGATLVLLVTPCVVALTMRIRRGERLIPVCVIGYLAALVVSGNPITRYLLPVLPWLVLLCLEGSARFMAFVGGRRLAPATWAWLGLVLLLVNTPRVVKHLYEMHRDWLAVEQSEWADSFLVADSLRRQATPNAGFTCNDNQMILAYLSGLRPVPVPIPYSRTPRDKSASDEARPAAGAYYFVDYLPDRPKPRRARRTIDRLIDRFGFEVIYRNPSYAVYSSALAETKQDRSPKSHPVADRDADRRRD
jgi:hypothetical protein